MTASRRLAVLRDAPAHSRSAVALLTVLLCCALASPTSAVFESDLRSISEHLFNGQDADGRRFPYVASLRNELGGHFCGGALVGPSVVLTAAHCLEGVTATPTEVHLGRTCSSCTTEERGSYQTARVFSSLKHPRWDGDVQNGGDLALLFLDRELKGPFLRVLPVVDPEASFRDLQYLHFVGYGLVDHQSNKLATVLQESPIPFRSRSFCDRIYTGFGFRGLSPDAMCAGGAGVSTCQGDSGGPLIVKGSSPEQDFGVGILSGGGVGCGVVTELPGAFMSLFAFSFDLKLYLVADPNHSLPAGGSFPAGDSCQATSARYWRVVTDTTSSGWAWDVTCLKFYDTAGTELRGAAIDSAHYDISSGYGPTTMLAKASQKCSSDVYPLWGGRRSADGEPFYVGMDMSQSASVGRVEVWQKRGNGHNTFEVWLESSSNGADWEEVARMKWKSEGKDVPAVAGRCGATLEARYV